MYILKGKKVVSCPETLEWGKWMQKRKRILKQERIGQYFISTVFLGLDYDLNISGIAVENPLIFETMIFDEENKTEYNTPEEAFDGYQVRYRTYDDAMKGHKEAVKMVKKSLNKK